MGRIGTSQEHLEALWLIVKRLKMDYHANPSRVSAWAKEAIEDYEREYGEISHLSKPFWLTQGQ